MMPIEDLVFAVPIAGADGMLGISVMTNLMAAFG
jgi:hypothetical protein